MLAIPKGRPRWSNIGFVLLATGLASMVAGPPLSLGVRQIIVWTVLLVGLVAFLYPLGEERLERRRALIGVIIGGVFLVLVWWQVLEELTRA